MCTYSHTHPKIFATVPHTYTYPVNLLFPFDFILQNFYASFFSYCYHPEEHVFHSDSVSVFSLLYLCLLQPVVVIFIFTICYVSRNSRTLFSVCLTLFKYFVHFFLFCCIVNAVAYNFFLLFASAMASACYQICFAACLQLNSVYLHFVC